MHNMASWLVSQRWWCALAILLLVVFSSMGLSRLHFNNDYRMFFSPDNPELKAFEDLQNKFARSDSLLIVVKAREGDLFTANKLAALEQLTDKAWRLPVVRRVDSITNFQHSAAVGDDLSVGAVIEDAHQLDAASITQKRQLLLNEPMLLKRLLSTDATTTGIAVSLALDDKLKDEQVLEVAAAARQLASDTMKAHPELEVRLTGSVMLDVAFHDASSSDAATLIPAMLTLALLLCWWLTRSLSVALMVGTVISLSILVALGCAGWLGIPLSPSAMAAPNIIMTLAVADAIHFLTAWQLKVAQGVSSRDAMQQSLTKRTPFVAFTTVATMISFLSMNSSDAPPFHDLGNITTLGVLAAFLVSLLLLPALAILLPTRWIGQPRALVPKGLNQLFLWICARPRTIAAFGFGSAILLTQALWLNELDDEYVKYFDQSIEFRQDTDWTQQHLSGIYELEYALPAGKPDGIYDPVYLAQVDQFAEWLRQQPEVNHVFSLVDVMRKLNRNFHGDDPSHYQIPANRELAAQYFLTYELALPQGMEITDRVDVSRSELRLTASLDNLSSEQVRNLEARAHQWLKQNTAPQMHVHATGASILFANIGQRNITSMIKGEVLSMIIVGLLFGLALRSLKLGMLSLIPIVLPAGVAFGIWGLMVGQVGLASAVVAAMTLGILADDTVHFLGSYHEVYRQSGNRKSSVEAAFHDAGQALVITTAILTVGFGLLAFSDFRINADLGLLTVVVLLLGLIADFVLLPAFLLSGVSNESEQNVV